jgi:hypothetical protein
MGSKDAKNAQNAQNGAQDLGNDQNPDQGGGGAQPCKNHWIGVRVVDENGKAVAGVKMNLKLPDNSTSNITFDKKGSYTTPKNLDPGNCEISFPDLFDAEWTPQ